LESHDHCQVGEPGRFEAERPVGQDLAGSVGDMVLAPDDVGDAHEVVVDNHGVVISRKAVGSHQDRISDELQVEGHRASNKVVEADLALIRDAESHHGLLAVRHPSPGVLQAYRAATSAVNRHCAHGQSFPAALLQLLG
jgi:hypothetical protein